VSYRSINWMGNKVMENQSDLQQKQQSQQQPREPQMQKPMQPQTQRSEQMMPGQTEMQRPGQRPMQQQTQPQTRRPGQTQMQQPPDQTQIQHFGQTPVQPQVLPPQTAPGVPVTPIPGLQPGDMVPPFMEGPPPVMDIEYIPGYLRSIIGRRVRAEFIIGSNQYTDRTGVLIDVGVNYFVLNDVNSRTNIMCDLYSVKFVTVLLD